MYLLLFRLELSSRKFRYLPQRFKNELKHSCKNDLPTKVGAEYISKYFYQ